MPKPRHKKTKNKIWTNLDEAGATDAFSRAVAGRVRLVVSLRFRVVYLANDDEDIANSIIRAEEGIAAKTPHLMFQKRQQQQQ